MRKTVVMIGVTIGLLSGAASAALATQEIVFNQNHFVTIGNEALVKGKFERASKFLRLAVKSNLSKTVMVNTLNNLCAADYLQDKLELAKESCDKAIKINHKAWRPYVIRGHIYSEQGSIEQAKLDYNTAQQLKPGEKISKRFLAKLETGDSVKLAQNGQ